MEGATRGQQFDGRKGLQGSESQLANLDLLQTEHPKAMDPVKDINEEPTKRPEMSSPPHDDWYFDAQGENPMQATLLQDSEEQEDALELVNEYILNEEEVYDELHQEKLQAILEEEMNAQDPKEESHSMQLANSLVNTSSVLQKLEQMEVMQHKTPTLSLRNAREAQGCLTLQLPSRWEERPRK